VCAMLLAKMPLSVRGDLQTSVILLQSYPVFEEYISIGTRHMVVVMISDSLQKK
jgi:hypothetical protein